MAVKTLDKSMIDAALLDPSVVFDCPVDVVLARGASDAEKIRILHRWEYDIREEEVAQEENMPGELHAHLVDSPDLAAGFIVWLCSGAADWARGRFLSSNWDVAELDQLQNHIFQHDLLVNRLRARP